MTDEQDKLDDRLNEVLAMATKTDQTVDTLSVQLKTIADCVSGVKDIVRNTENLNAIHHDTSHLNAMRTSLSHMDRTLSVIAAETTTSKNLTWGMLAMFITTVAAVLVSLVVYVALP